MGNTTSNAVEAYKKNHTGSSMHLRRHVGGAKGMKHFADFINMAQHGYQNTQGLTSRIKPLLGEYGGQYGQQANDFLHSIGLGKKRRGGYTMKGKSPLSSSATGSKNLDLAALLRTAEAAAQVADQAQKGYSTVRALLPENARNWLGSYGLGKKRHGGYTMKGKSPLSSSATGSKNLDLAALLRTAEAAAQVADQAQKGYSTVRALLPEGARNWLGSYGLGKHKAHKAHKAHEAHKAHKVHEAHKAHKVHDGRSKRAAIVRQVMHSHGVSLPVASRMVKEQGLYKGGRVSFPYVHADGHMY